MLIYKITNTLNGKLYIGQTTQKIERRFLQHSKAETPLGNAMRNCGLENFTIEVIEECITKEQANEREKFWIRVLKCKIPNGYNQCDGGAGVMGKIAQSSYRVKKLMPNEKNIFMTVAEGLKRFREERGLTQKDVATAAGILPQAYQKYEYGKVLPVINVLIKIADTYDVSIDYLVGRPNKH